MTDTPPAYSEFNSAPEDLSKVLTTENIVHKEAPRYGFLNPAALANTSNRPPGMVQYQPQMGLPGYGRSTPYMVNTPPGIYSDMSAIDSYQAWSILNILCCCWIFGCIACHYSGETETLKTRGDMAGAVAASKNARTMNIVATVGGLFIIVIVIILVATGAISHPF